MSKDATKMNIVGCFMDSNSIAAIIGVALGAGISGAGKLYSNRQKRKQIKATVKHDLQALWGRFYLGVEDFMNECEKDRETRTVKSQLNYIGITQNYFSCFDAISGEIAVLPDSKLSQEIFDTYTHAKGTVDTILTNNQIEHGMDKMVYCQNVYDELVRLKNKIETLTAKL